MTFRETPRTTKRLLRFPEVRARVGLSRSTIRRLERAGSFPKHHRLSPGAVGWPEEDINNWIANRERSAER
jgi:prophage regulatory protein